MALQSKTNLPAVVINYLQQLKVPFTKKALKGHITENAFYPSLFSISDTLDKYHVANEAYSVEAEHFDKLVAPFVAYCKNLPTGKDFVLVTAVDANNVTYVGEGKPTTVTRDAFMQMWQNVVLIGEASEKSGEPNYAKNLKKEKAATNKSNALIAGSALLLGLAIATLFSGIATDSYLYAGWITITKLLGTAIATLLLIYELDKSNAFVKNLCTAGKQTDCDAVLNSKASGIAGIKWSEAGFFYFAATALFLLYPGIDFATKLPWLAIAATGVALYIPFSIYYQYKVVKQWCPLCLATQAVLLLELLWAITVYWLNSPELPLASLPIVAAVVISILLPVIGWYATKQVFHDAKDKKLYAAGYKRLLYNPDYFNQLLQEQTLAPDGWQDLGITIGNPDASTTIIKVCNPYCGPCAKAHPVLEEIVHRNHDVNLKVIFTATDKEEDRGAKPVKHLLAIAARNDMALTQKAMDDWYMADKKDYDAFAAKYPLNGELSEQGYKLTDMHKWCNEAGIVATPTIFINGRQLPETYQIAELKNIM